MYFERSSWVNSLLNCKNSTIRSGTSDARVHQFDYSKLWEIMWKSMLNYISRPRFIHKFYQNEMWVRLKCVVICASSIWMDFVFTLFLFINLLLSILFLSICRLIYAVKETVLVLLLCGLHGILLHLPSFIVSIFRNWDATHRTVCIKVKIRAMHELMELKTNAKNFVERFNLK